MRELLLLRHGATRYNELRLYSGAEDVPLSEGGEHALLARKACGVYPPGDTFFTSGMLRAEQTLRLLYGDVPATAIPALAECNLGAYQGHTHQALWDGDAGYRHWVETVDKAFVCPGGESLAQFEARVRAGWHALLGAPYAGRTVLVSHGGVLRQILAHLTGDDEIHSPANGCGFTLWLREESGALARWEAFA